MHSDYANGVVMSQSLSKPGRIIYQFFSIIYVELKCLSTVDLRSHSFPHMATVLPKFMYIQDDAFITQHSLFQNFR